MNKNRTSSFPADNDDKVLLGFAFSIFVMTCAAYWVYTEKNALIGVFMMALVAAQSLVMVLYRKHSKNKNNNSAGT